MPYCSFASAIYVESFYNHICNWKQFYGIINLGNGLVEMGYHVNIKQTFLLIEDY
jgi:hypothetical protein